MVKRKTNEEFLKEVYKLVQDEYTFLGEYVNARIKIKVKHNKCGNEYLVKPNAFLQGKRCPNCYGTSKKTTQQFKEEVYNLVGDEYSVISKYINSKTKILFKHNECGNQFEMTPNAFLKGQRCPKCAYKELGVINRKTTEQFKKEVFNLVQDEYSVLSKYNGAHSMIRMKHNKCGSTYKVIPNNFLKGSRCPNCYQKGSSHGNEAIAKYLDEHNIKYIREYRFKDCVYKSQLPFDFYLPNYHIAIEYDGEQHYIQNNFFKEHDPFKERQIKDKIKSKYCFEHGIKLIRIKYTQFNGIDSILDKELTN